MRRIFFFLVATLLAYTAAAQTSSADFTSEAIPDSIWTLMQGKTYHDNPHIGRADLRYLRVLHYDQEGRVHRGEMVCNHLIADKMLTILRTLYEHRYPIERMVLPDVYDADDERQMRDNNTSCFCYRAIAGSTKLSNHARGLAVDINSLYNPYCLRRKDGSLFVQPATATAYCDRRRSFPYKITPKDLCVRLFKKHGFQWGGDWTTRKDYQHFEYVVK